MQKDFQFSTFNFPPFKNFHETVEIFSLFSCEFTTKMVYICLLIKPLTVMAISKKTLDLINLALQDKVLTQVERQTIVNVALEMGIPKQEIEAYLSHATDECIRSIYSKEEIFRPHHHRQGRRACGWLRQICVQDDDWTGGISKIGGFLS